MKMLQNQVTHGGEELHVIPDLNLFHDSWFKPFPGLQEDTKVAPQSLDPQKVWGANSSVPHQFSWEYPVQMWSGVGVGFFP